MQKLARWRTVFASWQLGTRSDTDAECKAIKHHREATIMLRAEVNALTFLLIEKKVISDEEYDAALLGAVERLDADYAAFFPGFKSTDAGMTVTPHIAKDTMAGWPP